MLSSIFDVLPQALDTLRNPALQPQFIPSWNTSLLGHCSDPCDGETLLAQPASGDSYSRHLDAKAGEPVVHAQDKMQSENKVNGSYIFFFFPEGCFF